MCAVSLESGLPTAGSVEQQRAPVEEIDARAAEIGSDDEEAESVSNEYVLVRLPYACTIEHLFSMSMLT